jgi:NADH-quinone oxidoreductase subunit F
MPKLTPEQLRKKRDAARADLYLQESAFAGRVLVHMGTCGVAAGAQNVLAAVRDELEKRGITNIKVVTTGCAGFCSREPMMTVEMRHSAPVKYGDLNPEKTRRIVAEHIADGHMVAEWVIGIGAERALGESPAETMALAPSETARQVPRISELAFFNKQALVVLRNKAIIDPERIEDYMARDGYAALEKVLTALTPEKVIEEITSSGLRGRGGAGFPTGIKWRACRGEKKTPKYIIGNCDEGDPGAYMDRSLLESDPHAVIEGMTVAAYAIGALRGYVYVRSEYPLAIQRLQGAITQARENGLLGENILGSDFDFDMEIRQGSGAFVCGEETSLIHSIEGESPEPRQRPPFPAQVGLWGCPTVINNVETLANVPVIITCGAEWFSGIGTTSSKGTKIFSLVGKINNTGLIEVPMGITLREIIYDIGGGIPGNKRFKAVQTGGPSGGCIPSSLMGLPIDYESLKEAGSIMGSGGMIVMDEDTCMVDVAKFFVQFTNDESCGKCSACREGSGALLEVLTRISDGEGREGDLEFLEELGQAIKDASMCGLGQTLPNPVLSALRHFREEFEAHIKNKRCPAVVCRGIISSPCQFLCPLDTDVPAYLTLTAQGRYKEALEVIRRTNPLPLICGRVCMGHCEARCRAAETGGPISVKEIKRFLSDWELKTGGLPPAEPFNKKYDEKVAIIGSGPAGLTAGYALAQRGYEVTVFEALPVAGGMLAVGIPEYRLPRELLQMEIDAIARSGVAIKTNSPVRKIETLLAEGYKAVLIAVGAHKNRKMGIPGEETGGVVDPIAFLRRVSLRESLPSLGHRVGVVGGGSTAIDAARTALRLGAQEVTILYRRTRVEMPAAEVEVEAALEEGVKIEFLVAPTRVFSTDGKLTAVELTRMKLGEPDITGRRRPIPVGGSQFIVELDALIPAISQDPELSFLADGRGIDISKGTVGIDSETFMTARPGVFACGDAVTGAADVTTAMSTAKIAASFIHKYLRREKLVREYAPTRPSVRVAPIAVPEEETAQATRAEMLRLPAKQRKDSFAEVELGLAEEAAVLEARRCLRCDWELQKRLRLIEAEALGQGKEAGSVQGVAPRA